MEIKGVRIQNEANYYKILSVIKNRKEVTTKEVKSLNSFLNGKETKEESINALSVNRTITNENKGFSGIRGIAHKKSYSFFKL